MEKNTGITSDPLNNLPPRQRMVLSFQEKLKGLVKKHPKLSVSLDEKNIFAELSQTLTKVGFELFPQSKQTLQTLQKSLLFWLKNEYLVLLHYRPQSGGYNLVNLLRAVKSQDPNLSFSTLLPLFTTAPSSEKQLTIFKTLANFGIRYVSFLTPYAVEEVF